jgi:hypothetical protein
MLKLTFLFLLKIASAVHFADFSQIVIPTPDDVGEPRTFDFSTYVTSNHNNYNRRSHEDDDDEPLDCEVGLLGCGTTAIYTQMFLMDRNYTTCCFDTGPIIAPQCNTEPTTAGYADIGAALYRNLTKNQELGYGNFSLNMAAFINQYAPYGIFGFPPFGGNPSYEVDLKNVVGANFFPAPNTSELTNLVTCQQMINAKWPFLENAEQPDVLPQPMPVPFLDFLDANATQLAAWNVSTDIHECFLHYNRTYMLSMTSGAMTPARNVSLVYALEQLLPSFASAAFVGELLFVPIGGCRAVFATMQARLNATAHQSIYLNTLVTKVTRPSVNSNGPIKIHIKTATGKHKVRKVGRLIVTIPQNAENLEFMDLDDTEQTFFEQATTFPGYFTTLLRNNGSPAPIIINKDYTNVVDYLEIDPPAWALIRPVGGDFYAGFASSVDDITDADMLTVLQNQLAIMRSNLTAPINMTLLQLANGEYIVRHIYFPHFESDTLNDSPDIFQTLRSFDGRRNTWYFGSLRWYPDGSNIADGANFVINRDF